MSEFWYDYIKPNIKTMQNYVIWILTALLLILKLKAFLKILQLMLKKDMILEMKLIDNYQKESIKKIIKQFVAIRPKT